jgi:hypothetical protein
MRKSLAFALLFILPSIALAYSSGPPNGVTGAPGEGTCVNCHTSFPLNSGDGQFSIEGPETFDPGQTYMISVHISDPGQLRWGFELTPMDQGSVTLTDPTNTQMQMVGAATYVKHTFTGTHDNTPDGPTAWSFDWTAPAVAPEQVFFFAAGNASNSSDDPTGDYIYTASFVTRLAVSGIDDGDRIPNALALGNYPNPFNAQTNITYELPNAGSVDLQVYDIAGRHVATLVDGVQETGAKTVTWDAAAVPSGIYFYRLTFDGQTHSQKMTLLK